MDDKHFPPLAQFKAFIKECESGMEIHDCIEEIFKSDRDINCQIPATELFKLEEPELIGCTALHLAVSSYRTDSFEHLLNRGANFTIRNGKGMTVLHQAIESSHNKSKECWKLKGQLTHARASLVLSAHIERNNLANPRDNHGLSHFHVACMLNHTKAVQFFLDGGVSPDEAVSENSSRLPGYTPLHFAARYCCFETTQLLLQHGADRNSRDVKNMTPLHLLLDRRIEITDHMLVHKRAPYDFFKEELDLNENIVKLFVDTQDCNATDGVGLSVLQVACTLEDAALVEKLLEQGANLDHAVSKDSPVWPSYTALHFSVHCNFKTVRLLLSRGANALAKDARGVTPLDLCLKTRNVESVHVVLTRAITQLNLEDIRFSDGTTKLSDLVHSMRSSLAFVAFLTAAVKEANVFVPHDSPLWPGYTPMHLAAVLPERTPGIEDLYETSDHVAEECSRKHYNCDETEETLYQQRIVLLLRMGADVTIRDARGSTPVHLAFPRKSENTFNWLFSNQGKILNPVDGRGLSHLHIACASRHQPFVERTLSVFGDRIDDRTTSSFEYRFVARNAGKIRRFSVNAGSTPMHIAVAACDFTVLETLSRHNANVHAQDSLGMTPIHLALKSAELHEKHAECWRFGRLLRSTDRLTECVTDFGLSHLHVASYMNATSAITKLLDAGADIETTIKYEPSEELSFLAPYDSYTPLHVAVHKDNESASETLAQRGADFLAEEPAGYALLPKTLISEHSRSRVRDVFVRTAKNDAILQKRILEKFGLTMLHLACMVHDADLVAELLNQRADPNALTNSNCLTWSGWSPLHVAMFVSCEYRIAYRIIESLLNHGADVALANSVGDTPVHTLFNDAYIEGCGYLELMLQHQKDYSVNPSNAEGVTHFHAACMSGSVMIVEEFLKHGVDVNLSNNCFPKCHTGQVVYTLGCTPLHVAVYHNQGDVIDMLLKNGADINARDGLGKTPLHIAARHSLNFENLFDKLVSAGADVHARTLLGATALQELTWTPSNWEQIELLTRQGHRVNSFNPLTREGVIGLSLYNDTEDLALNSFYEEIIDASDASDVDDMGRTPVHNIVSCRGFKTSVGAVGGFLKIGYDIDHQDRQGRTALHYAASFCNDDGIVGLLQYGADINITDNNKQTAFTYFLERKSERRDWYRKYTQDVVNIFVKHIYKLNFLKLSVNALNGNAYIQMIQKIDLDEQFISEFQNELEEAKKRAIDSLSISLFDLLSSETRVIAAYPNMPLPRRQAIKRFFETDENALVHDFPQLSSLLYLQYRKALGRSDLVESAKYSLDAQIGFNMPDLCSNIILKFLTNEDLKNLIFSNEYCQPRKLRKLD